VITYLMSFLTLGIFWNEQQAQLNHLERSDRHLTWIHMAFLFAVSLMPFSTRLLAEFMLAMCREGRACQERHQGRGEPCDHPAHCGGAGTLCGGRLSLLREHVRQHWIDRSGAT
jgi:hypothetical protein